MKQALFIILMLIYSTNGITDSGISENLLSIQNWEKVNENDGVSVYTSKTKTSRIVKVKTVVEINAPLATIQKILDDVKNRVDWVPFLDESRILHTFSATEKMEYSIFYGPWPASEPACSCSHQSSRAPRCVAWGIAMPSSRMRASL